jgi:HSP20 family molecular chaperone IbpA
MATIAINRTVSIRFADSIADEIETTFDEITRRAYELFLCRSGGSAIDIEDWLAAERELVVKPPARISMTDRRLYVSVDLAGIDAGSLEVVIAAQTLLIHSSESDASPRIFRTINLPWPLEARSAFARFVDSCLIFTAVTL